jgi:hypothetical protein
LALQCQLIATVTGSQIAGDARNRRHANARVLMNFSIGQTALEPPYDEPAIAHRFELCWGAQIFQERAAFGSGF